MQELFNRRHFLEAGALVCASLALPTVCALREGGRFLSLPSGFEHDVVKVSDGKPSILESAVTALGQKHGFDVTATKDGRVFDSTDFHKHAAVLFYTTGDLTTIGTDKTPAMSPQGKQSLLDAIRGGLGFIGVHAASDTFHTQPDTEDRANRYIAHGEKSRPICACWEVSSLRTAARHACRLLNIIVNMIPGSRGWRELSHLSALPRSGTRSRTSEPIST